MNCAAVVTDKLTGVKETQAKTTDLACVMWVDLIKFLEYLGCLFLGNPGPVIGNRHGEILLCNLSRKRDFTSWRSKLDRVVQEGVEGKSNTTAIDHNGRPAAGQPALQGQTFLLERRAFFCQQAHDNFFQIFRCGLAFVVLKNNVTVVEKVLNQVSQVI